LLFFFFKSIFFLVKIEKIKNCNNEPSHLMSFFLSFVYSHKFIFLEKISYQDLENILFFRENQKK